MVNNYKGIFSKNLHQKLKEKIVGKIYVRILDDDRLCVRIDGYAGLSFGYYYENISDQILHGLTTDYMVYVITQAYKKDVIRKHFY